MRGIRLRIWACSALVSVGAVLAISSAVAKQPSGSESAGLAYSIQLQATIDPATERWVSSALDAAAAEDAKLAIIRLDTPGGLTDSMRSIIEDMGSAPMPVVVYVYPSNARAGSAGAYITEAADVAAMYPVSNIGSATPIAIGPGGGSEDLSRKIKNDAAELLVTKAKNLTAREAKQAGLIDLIAPSQESLLRKLDGFQVKGPKAQVLHTEGLRISNHDMPLQYQLLEILVNPTVSYLLIVLGLVGLAIELFSPGLTAPGTIGVISLLLGFYGTAQLPVTVAGILLLVFGVGLIIAEAHLPTHGILGASGVAALVASGLLLYDTNTSAVGISAPVVIAVGLILGGLLAFAVQRAVQARTQPKRTGWEEMVGAVGEVRQPLDPMGQIFVEGALWRARLEASMTDERRLERGSRVRVESVEGLTLHVRPLESGEEATEASESSTVPR
jgi:membrane-bound serine protease (ClpP class)